VVQKIKDLNQIRKDKNLNFEIEIDGGINFETSKIAIDAGVDILVSGTTIFKENNGDLKKNIETLKQM
jgi:ribulose-phosphate 3-epimerase